VLALGDALSQAFSGGVIEMPRQLSLPSQSNRLKKLVVKLLVLAVITIAFGCTASRTICAQEPAKKDSPAPSPQTAELTPEEKIIQLEKRVAQLTSEVVRLRAELAKLEKYKQTDYTRDLMIKEEDRIRSLQSDLTDIAAKETALNKRLDEIEREQRPDRIERSMAGVGLTHPEQERDAIMTKLSNEKRQIQTQLETLRSTRARIPSLIANAEASISRLKQRLAEISR
jgi:peptidoglycan hydrolase CwlO-like protein